MSAVETRVLTSAPDLLPLYGRAVLPAAARRGERRIPERRLVLPDVAADRDRLRRYAAVCGFAPASDMPVTYPHIVAFPLAMSLMAARDFPFPLLGLVHLANRVERPRPVAADERLTYSVEAGQARPHPKGTTFAVEAEARAGGETVWRSTSTYLSRGRGSSAPGADEPRPEVADLTGARVQRSWNLPGSLGRSYAAVSGDRNPIHLHPLAARLLGFPRAIAHGMWTKARCLAALGAELPDALPGAYAVEVAFRAPVLLPTAVRFRAERSPSGGGSVDFDLVAADGRREHLRGRVCTPVPG